MSGTVSHRHTSGTLIPAPSFIPSRASRCSKPSSASSATAATAATTPKATVYESWCASSGVISSPRMVPRWKTRFMWPAPSASQRRGWCLCGKHGPFGRPASPHQGTWSRLADPRSCPGHPLALPKPDRRIVLGWTCVPHRTAPAICHTNRKPCSVLKPRLRLGLGFGVRVRVWLGIRVWD